MLVIFSASIQIHFHLSDNLINEACIGGSYRIIGIAIFDAHYKAVSIEVRSLSNNMCYYEIYQ